MRFFVALLLRMTLVHAVYGWMVVSAQLLLLFTCVQPHSIAVVELEEYEPHTIYSYED